MKKTIIVLVVLIIVGYAATQWASIYKTRSDLARVVAQQLDFVNDDSQPEVKQKLVQEAGKLGITLTPADIRITYEDTDVRSMAQQFTAKIATFVNKRATIGLRYTTRLAGIPLRQQIQDTKVRQIEVRQRENPQTKQILDSPP